MEIILLEKIKKLGDLGDTVDIKPGYARNYLLPQGKALPATEANRQVFEVRKAELIKKATDSLNAAKLRAAEFAGKTIAIAMLAAEEGRLYGSVGPGEVVHAAKEQGLSLKKHELDMQVGAIRHTGDYDVVAHLHSEVEVVLKVVVTEAKA